MNRRLLLSSLLSAPLAASAEPIELPDFVLDVITASGILPNNKAVEVVWNFYNKNKKTWGSFKLSAVSVNRNDITINKGKNPNYHFNTDLIRFMNYNYDKKYRIAR